MTTVNVTADLCEAGKFMDALSPETRRRATTYPGNGYQSLIREIHPTVNPAGVEAAMRLHHGTLDHLERRDFVHEVGLALACEAAEPGFLRRIAASFGMAAEFDRWEAA